MDAVQIYPSVFETIRTKRRGLVGVVDAVSDHRPNNTLAACELVLVFLDITYPPPCPVRIKARGRTIGRRRRRRSGCTCEEGLRWLHFYYIVWCREMWFSLSKPEKVVCRCHARDPTCVLLFSNLNYVWLSIRIIARVRWTERIVLHD